MRGFFWLFIALLLVTASCHSKQQGVVAQAADTTATVPAGAAIRLNIINGCGISGAAQTVRKSLERHGGVDIVSVGDAGRQTYNRTVIVARKNDLAELERLKALSGITIYTYARMAQPVADYDIIIGRDYSKIFR